jgi:two-component system sensor histidine kinase HydH
MENRPLELVDLAQRKVRESFVTNMPRRSLLLSVLPWAIMGGLVVLAPLVFFLFASHIRAEKENMTRLLVEKGAALIRCLEVSARMGVTGWGTPQFEELLTETAKQPDIFYLTVTDERGVIIADSDPDRVGTRYQSAVGLGPLNELEHVTWRNVQLKKGALAFEVSKPFTPTKGVAEYGHSPQAGAEVNGPSYYMSVGLDMSALEAARVEARRHTLAMAAGVLLVGFAGMVSLLLAQAYRLTRSSLAKVRAVSEQVVENLPMGLVATDEDGRVAAFNGTAEAILGRSSKKVIGEAAAEVLPPELWELALRLDGEAPVVEEDLACETSRGTALPLRVSAAVLRGGEVPFLGYVFVFRDLTEVRRLQLEVERSRRLASLGSLAAGVAHEIRNPLSSIKGFATYLGEKFRDDPQAGETATVLIQEVQRLDRVIARLLEFARPSALKIRAVRVADLIRHSLKLIEGDARARGVQVETEVPPDLGDVLMDEDRMSQALLNLYLNAIQAMDAGGTLGVKVSQDRGKGQTTIVVTDNGKGIAPGDLEHVFDPYFTTKSEGTGLGLAIVHKIVDAHRGQTKVRSTLGAGTAVTLTLPGGEEVKGRG